MSDPTRHGRRSRGYLPHFDFPESHHAITYRLGDALPFTVIDHVWREAKDEQERRARLEHHLDLGFGSCALRIPTVAQAVIDNWRRFDGDRYRLDAWVVMPNHVHVVIRVLRGYSLARIVHGWKSYTGNIVNRELGSEGPVWQREYWDRMIRDESHWFCAVRYVHRNPVAAKLVERVEDWPWSSAARELEEA